ncbi:MAG TPA: (2Fe-2S) ferredoxin domain-containing protein [Anaeromyxobacteraceae bacterium]|nr:(2Fe-2S) ferredoxin domain-containing protein [Anaeromyxobacteraceae bacterium]
MRYARHVFVCENRRPPGAPRGCCSDRGGADLRAALKEAVRVRGIQSTVRVNSAGCLDACEAGPAMVIYPEGVWYGKVTLADVGEIVESHLVGGKVVERLLVRDFTGSSKAS